MSRGYAQFVEIRTTTGLAWAAVTQEPWLRRWYALDATVEPRRGGAFRACLKDGRVRDATIDLWEPGKRLRLIYFPDAEFVALGDPGEAGPVVEDLIFDARPGRSVVRVFGSGVPAERAWDAYHARLRLGWAYHLYALKRALEEPAAGAGAEAPADAATAAPADAAMAPERSGPR